jgi:hypothetical protein
MSNLKFGGEITSTPTNFTVPSDSERYMLVLKVDATNSLYFAINGTPIIANGNFVESDTDFYNVHNYVCREVRAGDVVSQVKSSGTNLGCAQLYAIK